MLMMYIGESDIRKSLTEAFKKKYPQENYIMLKQNQSLDGHEYFH